MRGPSSAWSTGLRLNELRSDRELHDFLIDKATELSGAQRVLLVLDTEHDLRIAGSMLPRDEDPAALLDAVRPGSSNLAARGPRTSAGPEDAARYIRADSDSARRTSVTRRA